MLERAARSAQIEPGRLSEVRVNHMSEPYTCVNKGGGGVNKGRWDWQFIACRSSLHLVARRRSVVASRSLVASGSLVARRSLFVTLLASLCSRRSDFRIACLTCMALS